jgi:hypothetical protein
LKSLPDEMDCVFKEIEELSSYIFGKVYKSAFDAVN